MTLKDAALRSWHATISPWAAPLLERTLADGSLRLHRAAARPAPFAAFSVYRARNAGYLARLVDSAPAGSTFRFWALDEVHPSLASITAGHGPGARMPLLNRLIAEDPGATTLPLLLVDDDITFAGDAVGRFVGLAAAAGLDVAQPAHVRASEATYQVTRVVQPSTVRLTRFVESGPVVYVAPSARPRLTPFPADLEMGWGVDVWWSALQEPPLRLGVVDATPVRHHGAVGVAYPNAVEAAALRRYLERAGLTAVSQLDANVGLTWRPWQRRAKWLDGQIGTSPDG